ncbi:uncharacterized protein [Nicotiana sylvestris]|uniref:uncharacterized protein n=1 Tax=Nicotiana sylvestris TaxID=4096 RepID=UPI00388CC229
MALNNNDPLGNIPLGDDEDDDQVDEVQHKPQANRRGRPPQDNVPVPPPPPLRAAAHRVLPNEGYASAIILPYISAGKFQITNVMFILLEQRRFFIGAPNQNAYKHLKGFVDTCWGSKRTNISEDALRLRRFPFSLQGKALDWLERFPNHSIHTWDELAEKIISKFFSPGHMAMLRDEILDFKQEHNKPLHEICERYHTMVKELTTTWDELAEKIISKFFSPGHMAMLRDEILDFKQEHNKPLHEICEREIDTTNQCVINQLASGNFTTTPYAEACDMLDEMVYTSSAWQSRANVPQGDPNVIHLHKELHDHGKALNTLPKGALLSDTVVNPKGGNNMGHAMTVTTRSKKGGDATTSSQKKIVDDEQLVQEDEMPSNEVQVNDEVRIDIEYNEEETQEEVNPSREHIVDISEPVVPKANAPMPRPPPPYPQRLAKQNGKNQFKKFIDMMNSLSINVPLVEALEQMPGYAKFMNELITKKRSMNCETIKMTHQVSTIVHSMAPKLEDSGAFPIPCTIGSANFAKALCDLGASINLMPYSMFKTLGIGQPRPTSMRLQMADHTIKRPLGIIDNVLVRVDKFILPADFVILDCEVDYEVPIILGRPFLATGKSSC